MAKLHLLHGVCVLICLLLLMILGEAVTSPSSSCKLECCQGCVRNTYSTESKTKTVCVGRSRRTRYYTSCGFWGWGRCTRYRTTHYRACDDHTEYYIGLRASCNPQCSCVDQPH